MYKLSTNHGDLENTCCVRGVGVLCTKLCISYPLTIETCRIRVVYVGLVCTVL